MGASRDDFVKYPRTPHLFGSKGTDDDKHVSEAESVEFIADDELATTNSTTVDRFVCRVQRPDRDCLR
jgi:hypothetical protein